jgi:hypothetical protein
MLMEGKVKIVGMTDEFLEKIKHKTEEIYKNTQPVDCPYLKDKVYFNSRGWEHIKFKEHGKSRTKEEQYTRLKLFPLVSEVIRRSHTIQGIWKKKEWESQKKHGRWEKTLKDVAYYEFVAVIGKVRVKVVVKEVMGGQKYFWSIIPFWRMSEIGKERKLYDMDLENDGNVINDLELVSKIEKSPVS